MFKQSQAITMAHYLELGNNISIVEKKDSIPIINTEASEGADNVKSDREDTFSPETWKSEGHFIMQW